MKDPIHKRLDAIFQTESPETTELVPATPTEVVSSGNRDRDFDTDFDTARTSLHTLMEKSKDMVDAANYIAKEKQDAKSMEAAAIMHKAALDTTMALLDIHQKRADIEKTSTKITTSTNIQNNAVFVGTTRELFKLTQDLNSGFLKDALETTVIETTSEPEESKE